MPLNYKKLKLKAGLEIHQQLNTHKLFCSCPSLLRSDKHEFEVDRKLNPVIGETGKIDVAAAYEKTKNKTFTYRFFDTNCLVELDEEPPHEINQNALEIVLQIATLLNAKIFPVSQIMRKTVIDGSNTTGFQRTVLIAHDGYIETSEGKVRIETIALEEDSARPVIRTEDKTIYSLDRLGIPLIEITTYPDLKTPEQIKEAALKIGEILRACDVKRGIGTIRQDVNISIQNGNRVEIKGFQDPKIMIKTVDYEINRQDNILNLKSKLSKIKLSKTKDLTKIFEKTKCNFIQKAITENKNVTGFKLENAKGIIGKELQPNKRLGTDLSDFAKPSSKIGGIIHSDEKLSKYEFSDEEIEQVKKQLSIQKQDAFILIVGTPIQAQLAHNSIKTRIKQLTEAVPSEVRKSNPDATTTFIRPMPGRARMYPETDCELLQIKKQAIDKAKNNLPKLASENKKYLQEHGVDDEMVKLLLKQNKIEEFKELTENTNHYNLAAKALTLYPTEFTKKENKSRKEVDEILNVEIILAILEKVPKEIAPHEVKTILHKLVQGKTLEQALAKTQVHLSEEIKKIIKEKPGLSQGAYMGLIMKKFSGQITGKEVAEELRKVL